MLLDQDWERGLEFDPATHTYTVNGKKVMSVTQIITAAGLVDPYFFTEESRLRGTAVHEAVFLDIHDDLHMDSLHPVIKPYLEAWLSFKAAVNLKPLKDFCERRMFNPFFGYTGTPDIVCGFNGRGAVIDIKSGAPGMAHIQTSAYEEMPLIKDFVSERYSLQLRPDGTFRLNKYSDRNDFLVFMKALQHVKNNQNQKGE